MEYAAVVAVVALLAAGAALGGDGQIELSQAKAGGVFPIVLSAPGSYVLTSNLTVGMAVDAISVPATAAGVTLDLNGFEIIGPCSALPCTGAGSGIVGSSTARVTVRNGTVRSMAGNGIELGAAARVEDVTAAANALDGIHLGPGAVVTRAIARGNGDDGISVDSGSTVGDSTSLENGSQGFQSLGTGVTIARCSARDNAGAGINVTLAATVVDSSATLNDLYGISVGAGSMVARNTVSSNGMDGIFAGEGSNVVGNSSRSNQRHGIHVAEGTRVEGNASTENVEYGVRIQLGGAGTVHLVNNQIRANGGSGVGASEPFGSVATGLNSISGNGTNFDATVLIIRIACDQVAGALLCPP